MTRVRMQDAINELISDLVGSPGALLPILHRVQGHFGFVPGEAVPVIAKALNLSRAEVHGVVTFYPDFRSEPAGAHVIRVCQAEACQAMGSADLTRHIEERLRMKIGNTRADRQFTLEPVYCLGLCAVSPAAMVDEKPVGRASSRRMDELISAMEKTP